ncbi:MAG: triose-phosphate isomerase [Planctomycetes bacterium]|nr:triose-phosphate isomerase [Planctomycetota bacterium]
MTNRTRKPYIAGNWKMNLDRARSLDLIKTIKGRIGDGGDREVAFFAPAIYLADVAAVAQGSPLGIGGQNIWYEADGAFTGELAPRMLREVGADRVLVGHSERRHLFHEANEWMGRKVRAALDVDLLPIYCIGETFDERNGNRTDRVLKKQLESGFEQIKAADAHRLTIAYEPVWAIGTGETATVEQVDQTHRMIRKWMAQRVGDEASSHIRVLYGGSVKPDNARELMAIDDVDGLLVGGASLQAESFLPIIEYDR